MDKLAAGLAVVFVIFGIPGGALAESSRAADGGPVLLALFGWGEKAKDGSPLDGKEKELARSLLGSLEGEARFVFFEKAEGCRQCAKVKALLEELASLAPALSLEVESMDAGGSRAASLGVDKSPVVAILGPQGKDTGIRYYGLPLGYEFEAFLRATAHAARGENGLARETVEGLARLDREVTIGVFVARH